MRISFANCDSIRVEVILVPKHTARCSLKVCVPSLLVSVSSESSLYSSSTPSTVHQRSRRRGCASLNSFMFQYDNANFLTLSVSKRFLTFVLIRPCMLRLRSAAQEEGDTESDLSANNRSSSNSWRTAGDLHYTSSILLNYLKTSSFPASSFSSFNSPAICI